MHSEASILLQQIESFCRRSGIAESTFGREVVNDGKLCTRLRDGRNVTLETPMTSEQREYLTMIRASADTLLNVVNDVLQWKWRQRAIFNEN